VIVAEIARTRQVVIAQQARKLASETLAFDRVRPETTETRNKFARVKRAEASYARALRRIARHVGELVRGLAPSEGAATAEEALRQYADMLGPWARAAAARMLADVARRDELAWAGMAQGMARALRNELRQAPTGHLLQALMAEQVTLITSIPREAADRVHELALEGLTTSARASEVAKEIMRSGDVARSRANLIARTETSRAASTLVQARAEHVGSVGYIWRTARDSDVRPSHRKMEGRFVDWNNPPMLDNLRGHAGALPNCRCYSDPQIPEFP
jgi:SPP1 gp7 family putative phage head morphogenesis protein